VAIVYGSDLTVAPELTALYEFPASSHDPIVYPALVSASGNKKAERFLDFLSGGQGQSVLAKYGFRPVLE
jgi:molybdate transport system substrate-binding protein